MSRRTAVRDPWVWGQVAMVAVIVAVLPGAVSRWGVLDPGGPARWLGLGLIAAGVAIASAGALTLGPNLTPATEPVPDARLVTRGIYRMVRHPIYLGVSTIMGGYGMLRGGWWAGAAAFAVALAYFELKARVEERFLMQRMAGYGEYRRMVPRILPGGWH
jgi:protein-S-isoprenylcysteine O-methyltransferase Ste14